MQNIFFGLSTGICQILLLEFCMMYDEWRAPENWQASCQFNPVVRINYGHYVYLHDCFAQLCARISDSEQTTLYNMLYILIALKVVYIRSRKSTHALTNFCGSFTLFLFFFFILTSMLVVQNVSLSVCLCVCLCCIPLFSLHQLHGPQFWIKRVDDGDNGLQIVVNCRFRGSGCRLTEAVLLETCRSIYLERSAEQS